MRRAPVILAVLRSTLLGIVLISAAEPGPGAAPDLGKRWVAAVQPGATNLPTPDLGKRWS